MKSAFHLKSRKSRQRKDGCRRQDINDGIFITEKENEKEKKSSTAETVGQRNIFTKGTSWSIYTVVRT